MEVASPLQQEYTDLEAARARIAELESELAKARQELFATAAAPNGAAELDARLSRQLVDTLPDIIYIKDADGYYLLANQPTANLYGCSLDDIVGKTDLALGLPREQYEGYCAYIRQILATKQSAEIPSAEFTHPKTGETLIFRTRLIPLIDADGVARRVLGVSTDITQLKHTEEELRRQRAFLRDVIDVSPNLVFAKDVEGRFILANKALADFYNTSTENIVGKTDADFNPAEKETHQFNQDDRWVIRTGASVLVPEEPVSRWDGAVRYFQTSKVPIKDENGKPVYVMGVSTDITERKYAEQALSEREAQLRSVIENAPIILYTIDKDGKFTLSEGRGLAALGLKPGQVVGMSAFDLYRDNPEIIENLRAALSGKTSRYTARVGERVFDSWLTPLVEKGETVGALGVAIDTTESVRAQEALRQSQTLLQLVLDTIPVRVFWKMTDYTYGGCNRLFAQDAGLKSPQDLIGRDDYELFPNDVEIYRPDDERVIKTGETRINYEEPQTTPDGATIWLRTSKIPLRDADGKIIGVLGTYDDITAQKNAEAERERLIAIIENSQDMVSMADLNGRSVYMNPAGMRLTGYDRPEDVMNAPISKFHPEEGIQRVQAEGIPVAMAQGSWRGENTVLRKDGQLVPVEQSIFTVRDKKGELQAMGTIVRDITERKQAERERDELRQREHAALLEAQEAVRLKDLFLATMSHELRTPLNAIIGFQHLMIFSDQLDEDNIHMAERTLANSQRLLHLINDILDISRIASGGLHIVPVSMSVQQMAQTLYESLNLMAKEKNLALSYTVDASVPPVIMHDVERISQIVTNLVNNAIKFTEKGEVSMRFNRAEDRLVIQVQDTGVGIPPLRQQMIFDDFVQLDSTTTRKYQGAGLGLSIVRRLALLMNGSVRVESELDQGSLFTVDLPLNLTMSAERQ